MEVTSISESIDTELLFVSQNMHDVHETTYRRMPTWGRSVFMTYLNSLI